MTGQETNENSGQNSKVEPVVQLFHREPKFQYFKVTTC
jgi:hypothetical protein